MPSFREEVMYGPYNDLKANVMIHSSRFFPRNTHPHFPSFSLSQKHVSTEDLPLKTLAFAAARGLACFWRCCIATILKPMWNGSGGLGSLGFASVAVGWCQMVMSLNEQKMMGPYFPLLNDQQTRNCLRGWFALAQFFSVQEEHLGFHNAFVC